MGKRNKMKGFIGQIPIRKRQLVISYWSRNVVALIMKYERQNIVFRISSQITRLVYEN